MNERKSKPTEHLAGRGYGTIKRYNRAHADGGNDYADSRNVKNILGVMEIFPTKGAEEDISLRGNDIEWGG